MVTKEKKQRLYKKILSEYKLLNDSVKGIQGDIGNVANVMILAPVINLFVMWLLQEANKKNIKKLLFLARDGYPLYLVAKKYCELLKVDIECKYFYCSRFSLRVPLYAKDKKETLNHVCRGGIDVTYHKVLCRSGLSESEIKDVFNSMETKYSLYETIPYSDLSTIREKLQSNPYYWELVRNHSENAWNDILAYFRQEGLYDDDISMAIVDSGWTGTTQKSLNKILSISGKKHELQGFYFGLFEIPDECDPDTYFSFYFSPKTRMLRKLFFNNCFFENVLSANHGTTMGYTLSKGRMEPILGDLLINNTKKSEIFINTLMEYTDSLLESIDKQLFSEREIYEMIDKLSISLAALMWNPCKEEALYYGSLMFSDDVLDNNIQDLAARLSQMQLFDNHLLSRILYLGGVKTKSIKESAWYEGSAVLEEKFSLYHRCSYTAYKLCTYIKKGIR